MPGKLLLIADQTYAEQVRAEGELADSWWIDTTAENPLERLEDPAPWIRFCTPELLSEGSPLDEGDRADFINNLLDTTICYLAVVDKRSYGAPTADDSARADVDGVENDAAGDSADRKVPTEPRTLAEHARWYEAFLGEIQRRAQARAVHLRHVLILVCLDDPPNDQLQDFQRLVAGHGAQRLFNLSYVMLEELEPGRQAGQFCQAKHVWSIAVGSLLLKLLHDDFKPRAGPTFVKVWRSYQLAPEVDPQLFDRLCSTRYGQLSNQLLSDVVHDSNWELTKFTKFEPFSTRMERTELPEPDDGEEYVQESWLHSSATTRLDAVKAENRWEGSLSAAGAEVGRQLSRQTVEDEPAACCEAQDIWKLAHHDPRFVSKALTDHNLIRGPALADQFTTITERWAQVLQKDKQRETLTAAAVGCARHLDSAKDNYVNLAYRLLAIFAVTLFVGYVSMLLFHSFMGTWGKPLAVALAGAVGALVAGLLTLDREGAAGRRAKRIFVKLLARIDQTMVERHGCCQDAVEDAHVFWQQTWARAAATRLKRSLRRVQVMFDRELRYRPELRQDVVSRYDDGADEVDDSDASSTSDRRQRQQARFRQMTRLQRSVDLDDLQNGERSNELDEFVQDQADTFRDKVWAPFCERHDGREFAGNLPARYLIPELRKFRNQFHAGLLTKIRQLATQQIHPTQLGLWGRQINNIIEFQHFFEMMSCRVLGHQTAEHTQRAQPVLCLRRGFKASELMPYLTTPGFPRESIPSAYLLDLPIVGFLFQELPVEFGLGPDGKIVVGPYRGLDAPNDQDQEPDEA